MFRSTMDVLEELYPRLSPGGIVMHNNYEYAAPRAAIVEFRRRHGIEALPIHLIDDNSMYWRKQ